jgi:hypothetical protein
MTTPRFSNTPTVPVGGCDTRFSFKSHSSTAHGSTALRSVQDHPRTLARHYIAATEADIQAMFAAVGAKDFPDMYAHIDRAVQFAGPQDLPEELSYQALADRMEALSRKNSVRPPSSATACRSTARMRSSATSARSAT